MKKRSKVNKDQVIFWMGLGLGILGGIAGNMAVTSMYRLLDSYNLNSYLWLEFIISLITIIFIVALCFFMIRGTEKKKKGDG